MPPIQPKLLDCLEVFFACLYISDSVLYTFRNRARTKRGPVLCRLEGEDPLRVGRDPERTLLRGRAYTTENYEQQPRIGLALRAVYSVHVWLSD